MTTEQNLNSCGTRQLMSEDLMLGEKLDRTNQTSKVFQGYEQKIKQLQSKLREQTEAANNRELELQQMMSNKREKWAGKYLQVRVELENAYTKYNQEKRVWKQNMIVLFKAVNAVIEQLHRKDQAHLEALRLIEDDFKDFWDRTVKLKNMGVVEALDKSDTEVKKGSLKYVL